MKRNDQGFVELIYVSRLLLGEAVHGSFHNDLDRLQGQYKARWTEATWGSEGCDDIWALTEEVTLPALLMRFLQKAA